MTAVAALNGVVADYGRRALGPFDLTLSAGEIVALVGPSGCGKSTALRLLAGLEQPAQGTVTRTVSRGDTALVFQAPTLAPWLSALDNAALPLRLARRSKAQARAAAARSLERVGLGDAMDRSPAQLSGGMAMRASLARALVADPRLLLLDEPFAALDEITRRQLADDVLALAAELKPALLFVTHNVEEAVYMASRVVVMTPGPGRAAGEVSVDAPSPRPPGFRATPIFRACVERVSDLLSQAMAAA